MTAIGLHLMYIQICVIYTGLIILLVRVPKNSRAS